MAEDAAPQPVLVLQLAARIEQHHRDLELALAQHLADRDRGIEDRHRDEQRPLRLRDLCDLRHEELERRVRERLSVVSRRCGDEPWSLASLLLDKGEHRVQGAANLERVGRLQCFKLEEDVAARQC